MKKGPIKIRVCKYCGKSFTFPVYKKRVFCCKQCLDNSFIGRKLSKEHRKKISKAIRKNIKVMSHIKALGLLGLHKGKKRSAETRKKISTVQISRKASIETKRKMSLSHKGKKLTTTHRKRISVAKIGKHPSKETIEKFRQRMLGTKIPLKTRLKLSESHKGEKSYRWKGGITPTNKAIRSSFEYRQWRSAIFERDNYTYQFCGRRGCKIHADHIKQFAFYPELRMDVSNGRTLCVDCHRTLKVRYN